MAVPPARPVAVHLACVVPMYNEATHAARFLHALHAHLASRVAQVSVVVVDDGSRDGTDAAVRSVIDAGLPVRLLRLSRNFGKELAMTAGLAEIARLPVSADATLMIDGDFQHPFAVIDTMIGHWQAGTDMVYGVQVQRGHEHWVKRLLTPVFYRLLRAGDGRVEFPADAGDFRLMDRRVVEALNQLPERNRYMKGLYAWVGFSTQGVPFEAALRAGGRSSFGLRRLGGLALDGLTAFSSWPLRLASVFGLVISLLAFVYGCWIVIEWLLIGQPIAGFATLAAAIMFFSGVQLISIGLLGEYIGRIFLEVKGRPLYLVAERRDGLPADATRCVDLGGAP
jgi:polyisoprenyl-phosphate glycosyltransferase